MLRTCVSSHFSQMCLFLENGMVEFSWDKEVLSTVKMENCTVAFIKDCQPLAQCKETCRSMGAARFRWFHDQVKISNLLLPDLRVIYCWSRCYWPGFMLPWLMKQPQERLIVTFTSFGLVYLRLVADWSTRCTCLSFYICHLWSGFILLSVTVEMLFLVSMFKHSCKTELNEIIPFLKLIKLHMHTDILNY